MTTYTWTVESVHPTAGTMEVAYTHDGETTLLNIPQPQGDILLADFIDSYAPRQLWEHAAPTIVVGASGEGAVALPPPPEPDPAAAESSNTVGNVNEEYLRALIYTVLEEIKESTV